MSYIKRFFSFLGRLWRVLTRSNPGRHRQGPGQPRKGGGPGPDFFFDRLAGGKEAFDVNTIEVPQRLLRRGETIDQKRDHWRAFLEKKSVADGQMTRELFRQYVAERNQAANSGNGRGRPRNQSPSR